MKSIQLKNYKCFENTGEMELRPLNFLVGSNSSGKSSFLEFFPLLQQSMKINRDGAFLWVGSNVDLNNFHTVVRNGEGMISIEFNIDRIPLLSNSFVNKDLALKNVKVGIDVTGIEYGDAISEIRLFFNQQKVILKLNERESDDVIINDERMTYDGEHIAHSYTNSLLPKFLFEAAFFEMESQKGNKELYTWTRQHFKNKERMMPGSIIYRLRNLIDKKQFERRLHNYLNEDVEAGSVNFEHIYNLALFTNLNDIIDLVNYYMLELSENIEYLQPLRAPAERYYRKRNISVNKITPSGDNVVMFLLRLQREAKLDLFNEWLRDNDMKFKVDLNEEGGFIELKIIEDGKDGKNMVDVGFGYSQILPILTTIWKDIYYRDVFANRVSYCNTSIILIEQPELHLHPRFQRKFANLLTKCVKQIAGNKQDIRIIIETHSQDILNSVGLSVAYGDFDASLVNIYMFNAQNENMKNYIEKASYTKEGFLVNWPIGFFE
ncbi:AAA family ATPase [Xylanibacter brevis]|uniref:AAA family ATPase n=1 Tax=Xylanibacter brevis TaxID=83231 RepID=UPI000484093C|nr:AAA family ATPase [Xylanibacter brevis]